MVANALNVVQVSAGNKMPDKMPDKMFSELLDLLDRIEIEEDHTLAGQRFDIAKKYGYTVEFGELGSSYTN